MADASPSERTPLQQSIAEEIASNGRGRERNIRVLPMKHPRTDETFRKLSFSFWPPSNVRQLSWKGAFEKFFPCIGWISTYNYREDFQADFIAGLTVGVMLVPQAMSYAKLAGLPPIYGLYSGFAPVLGYAVFGTSRQLAVGPVALVSLLTRAGLSEIIDPTKSGTIEAKKEFEELAITLALLVGLFEAFMGLVRLGWLIRFLSHSVTSGFTSGAALIIAVSVLHDFLGLPGISSSNFFYISGQLLWLIKKGDAVVNPLVFGGLVLVLLLVMKEVGKRCQGWEWVRAGGPVTAVILGTVLVKLLRPKDVKTIGFIPQGFPPVFLSFKWAQMPILFKPAVVIVGVAILESVGIAKALASRNGYEIDSNNELLGLGLANILGSFFSAFPSAGSFSRSAVSNEVGARTGMAGLIVGVLTLATLLFITPLFVDVPQCVLSAIVLSAVMGLVDFEEARFLWRVEKKDFCLWSAAFWGTLIFGIEVGVLIAVCLSLVFVIHESANPHIAVLGRLPGTTVYRNVEQYPEAYLYGGLVIIRVDAPMYFANSTYIIDRLRQYELLASSSSSSSSSGKEETNGGKMERVQFVILDMTPVPSMDSTAVASLRALHLSYGQRGVQLALCNCCPSVMGTMGRAGMEGEMGKEWFFVRVHDAVQVCLSYLQGDKSPEVIRAALRNDNVRNNNGGLVHMEIEDRHSRFVLPV